MDTRVAKRLWDAKLAAEQALSFVSEESVDSFTSSMLLRSAVERQLEIVGEALGKAESIDRTLGQEIQEIPQIVGLRNRLAHGYDNIDERLIWDIVNTKLPSLVTKLAKLLVSHDFPVD